MYGIAREGWTISLNAFNKEKTIRTIIKVFMLNNFEKRGSVFILFGIKLVKLPDWLIMLSPYFFGGKFLSFGLVGSSLLLFDVERVRFSSWL